MPSAAGALRHAAGGGGGAVRGAVVHHQHLPAVRRLPQGRGDAVEFGAEVGGLVVHRQHHRDVDGAGARLRPLPRPPAGPLRPARVRPPARRRRRTGALASRSRSYAAATARVDGGHPPRGALPGEFRDAGPGGRRGSRGPGFAQRRGEPVGEGAEVAPGPPAGSPGPAARAGRRRRWPRPGRPPPPPPAAGGRSPRTARERRGRRRRGADRRGLRRPPFPGGRSGRTGRGRPLP